MDTLDDTLGSCPIDGSSLAGISPRDGVNYAAAQIEIDRLNNIHSDTGVNWSLLAKLCSLILREEGKDLNAATWLLCAWTSVEATAGLVAGVHVLREMLENYWDSFTPSLSRLRARRNQGEWLLEWLDNKLDGPGSFAAIESNQLQSLLNDWDVIDSFWRERDADGPSFFRLRRRLSQLPVLEAPGAVVPVAAETTTLPDMDTPAATSQKTVSQVQRSMVAPPIIIPMGPISNQDSDEAIERSLNGVFASVAPLITFCLENSPTLPLFFRLNRQLSWMTIEIPPPAEGVITRLPPPPENQLESFARLQSAGDPLDILRFCEGRLMTYPFWLDLNRASHAALLRLGSSVSAAANSLMLETRQLIARLPALAQLCFSDGQAFADGITRSWLEGLVPDTQNEAALDKVDLIIEQAGHSAAQGQLDEALASLQSGVRQTSVGRDRFRLRRAQCELMHRFDPRAHLSVALDVLLRDARQQGLEQWEPDLVRPLLELAVVVKQDNSENTWGEQLASMDLPAFWRLSSAQDG